MLITWAGPGHVWPFINFAKVLRKHGMEVSFIGFDSDVERFNLHKFDFQSVGDDKVVRSRLESGTVDEKTSFFEELMMGIGAAVGKFEPDLVFIDPMSHISVIAAVRAGIEARYLWVFNPAYRENGHLPFCKVRRWREYLFLRKFRTLQWFAVWLVFQHTIFRKKVRGNTIFDLKVRPKVQSHGFGCLFGVLGYMTKLPSVVLGPQIFADSTSNQVTYLGLNIEPRPEEFDFKTVTEKKIVFVSFGSNFDLYDEAERITNVLISVAKKMSGSYFIFHAPEKFKPSGENLENVVFETKVPVYEILKKATVVITHGGYGGVKESIFFRVPMLVIPFAFDQPGNAYHVEKNGVGLVVSPREVSERTVQSRLDRLIRDSQFLANIENLADRMIEEDQVQEYVEKLKKELLESRES